MYITQIFFLDINRLNNKMSIASNSSSRTYSLVWNHFTPIEEDGKAQCNYCGAKYKRTGGNTTSLNNHLKVKHPNKLETEAVNSGEIDKFVTKDVPRFTAGTFREFIVKWIVCGDQPFTVIEDENLRKLLRLCNPNAKPLSADTIHDDIIKSFENEKKKIQEILQNAPGRLSFTLDAWTSPNYIPFLGITVHWISQDWQLKEILIDFCKLSGPHSGENLFESFESCCNQMNVLTKIMAVTTDNATNNNTLMRMLQSTCQNQNIGFTAHNNHVRCLAHVINLAAQDALSKLKVDYAESEDEILNYDGEINEVIPKLRKLVVKIRSSPQRREKLARQCEAANLLSKELVLDVRTRWNSTYNMIERCFELREALDNIATVDRDLRKWELVDTEWELLDQIKSLLFVFSRATHHISHNRFPTIEHSIPIYNWLMDKIEDFQNRDVKEAIKTAAKSAMEKLKKYYKNTDALVYTVSTILDPRLKLTYHTKNNWEERYITEARKSISQLYEDQYAPVLVDAVENDEHSDDDLFSHMYKKRRLSNNENELDSYLGTAVVPGDVNILQWWKLNESQFPHLAEMARDFLAIPATSVPIERAFSGGTDLVALKRCSLSAKTIQACMCLKSWWRLDKN